MANGNDPLGDMLGRLMREVLGQMGDAYSGGDAWSQVADKVKPTAKTEPSKVEQRENLMFALADRAVTALEDIALNVAAVRQRFEKVTAKTPADYVREARNKMREAGEDPDREVRAAESDTERPDGLWND